MTQRDLPPPLHTENDAVEHLEAVLALEDIVEGCLVLILCDPIDDHLQPIATAILGELPPDLPPQSVCAEWVGALAGHGGVPPSVVFGRARAGRSYLLDEDRAWRDAVDAACREHGLTLEAAFVVTQHATIAFPGPLAEERLGA